MELSGSEKLILVMLCGIYEKLGIKGEINPEFVKRAIYDNQTWGLSWKYSSMFGGEPDYPPIVRETVDILGIWSMIESAYNKFSDQDRETLKHDAAPFGDNVKFIGFDANNEAHFGVAEFLINNLGVFHSLKGRDLNSHCPIEDAYRRMLAVFKPIRKTLFDRTLNVAELTEILNDRKHPGN